MRLHVCALHQHGVENAPQKCKSLIIVVLRPTLTVASVLLNRLQEFFDRFNGEAER